MKRFLAAALLLSGIAAAVALSPHELHATKTVGDQARAMRQRHIVEPPEPHGPRLCDEGEVPSDRDPCIQATTRANF